MTLFLQNKNQLRIKSSKFKIENYLIRITANHMALIYTAN